MDWTRLSGLAAVTSVLSAVTLVSLSGHAQAHEPPFGTGVYASGDRLVLRMSRGLVLQSADPLEYRWLCNEALGVQVYDVPSVLVQEDGSLLVGTSTGLKRVSADGCEIASLPAFGDARVSTLARDPDDNARVYAATAVGFYESSDDGEHFERRDEHIFDTLEVSASDDVYASGKLTRSNGPARPYIARWRSGEPLELHEVELEPNEYTVALLGSDSEHVIAVARAYLGTTSPDRLLVSADGARSWFNSFSAPGIAAFALDAQNGGWLIGDATGLWRTTAQSTWSRQLGTAAISCLSRVGSSLYICDGAGPEGGVSESLDGGEHTRSLLRWNELAGLVDCPSDAPSVQMCQAALQDWERELPPGPKLAESEAEPARNVLNNKETANGCAAVRGPTLPVLWLWLTLAPLFRRIKKRARIKRSSMPKTAYWLIIALALLAGCSKDATHSEAGTTRSDAGSDPVVDSGTPAATSQVEDAAISDSGRAPKPDAASAADGGADSAPARRAGAAAEPQSVDAGAPPIESDSDAGPSEAGQLCAACGGCEEVIKVVSTMHTNMPVVYSDPPPTSGPHNPCWGRWGVHDEPLAAERWVHNLEHGGVVFLYNCPDGCEEDVAALKQLNQHRYRTIITAYADLPTRFGVVSWGHRLLSPCLDLEAYDEFYNRNFDHAPESNANPPNPSCPP